MKVDALRHCLILAGKCKQYLGPNAISPTVFVVGFVGFNDQQGVLARDMQHSGYQLVVAKEYGKQRHAKRRFDLALFSRVVSLLFSPVQELHIFVPGDILHQQYR